MRRPLVLAPLVLLPLLAAPAAAGQGDGCPNVAYAATQEQRSGPPGEPVTLTFASDVRPSRTPDRWVLTREDPAPEQLLDTAPSAPSATFTLTADVTTTWRVTAETTGCPTAAATFTRTVVSPSPSPSPSPSSGTTCPVVSDLRADPATARVGQEVVITATVAGGSGPARVELRRVRPAPELVVRTASAPSVARWTVRLGESHVLRASAAHPAGCAPLGRPEAAPLEVGVVPSLTIDAHRDAPRDYAFSGRVLPGRGQSVALYRVEDDGGRVLTSTTAVREDGTYRIERLFLGSGRFGFVVRVASSGTNLAGESRVRPTVVH